MRIISLNLGNPKHLTDKQGKVFTSAIQKKPSQEIIFLSKTGLKGDSSFEDCHGGESMALHMFCYENYAFFEEKAGFAIPIPAFGENITISGYSEKEARVGDIFKIGSARIQIAQPTERCATIGRNLRLPKMLKWIHEKLMTGFYLRVLEEGEIRQSNPIELEERGEESLNIARLNGLIFTEKNRSELDRVCSSAVLNEEWKKRAYLLYERAGM